MRSKATVCTASRGHIYCGRTDLREEKVVCGRESSPPSFLAFDGEQNVTRHRPLLFLLACQRLRCVVTFRSRISQGNEPSSRWRMMTKHLSPLEQVGFSPENSGVWACAHWGGAILPLHRRSHYTPPPHVYTPPPHHGTAHYSLGETSEEAVWALRGRSGINLR